MNLVPSPFPDQAEFRFWLQLIQPGTVVAENWNCSTCPLATFLRAVGFAHPIIFASGEWSAYGFNGPRRSMPSWANEFTYWIDKCHHRQLTVEDCLFIMDDPCFEPGKWDDGSRQKAWRLRYGDYRVDSDQTP